jgi:hypothetical protein
LAEEEDESDKKCLQTNENSTLCKMDDKSEVEYEENQEEIA